MDEPSEAVWTDPPAQLAAASGRGRARWIGPGLVMGGMWGLIDLLLEALNQATGLVAPLRPLSFFVGPSAAIVTGLVLGLRGRGDWARAIGVALGVAFAVILGYSVLSTAMGTSGDPGLTGGAGGYATVDIGTGGTNCRIEQQARTFVVGDAVRASAEVHPAIPKGTTVTITLRRDGEMEAGYPVVQVADSAWDCVYGDVAFEPLRPGHYRWELSTPALPPVGGEFDVTD